MKKIHLILLLAIGFLMIPSITYACDSKSDRKCCKKETSSDSQQDCCKKSKSSHGDGCGGKCGNPSCNCPVMLTFSLPVLPITYLENGAVTLASEKRTFHYREVYVQSGFSTLRLPPKIS